MILELYWNCLPKNPSHENLKIYQNRVFQAKAWWIDDGNDNHNKDDDLDDNSCVYDNDDFGDFWGDDDDVHGKISNICEDMKSATGSSQYAAGVDFDFKIFVASSTNLCICTFAKNISLMIKSMTILMVIIMMMTMTTMVFLMKVMLMYDT